MKTNAELKEIVKQTYGEIAVKKSSGCGCGCSDTASQALKASVFSEDYSALDGYNPDADLNLGCGIPTDIIEIKEGQTVVDLGSGAGNDCFVAGRMVGEKGLVIGVDMTKSMVELAKENAKKLGVSNVKFRFGEIEDLPITANKADVIISNCVINLVPDKHAAFNEIIRVLKPGGYFSISDIVVEGTIPQALREQASFYAGCVSGAISLKEYLCIMEQTGFTGLAVRKRKKMQLPDSLLRDVLDDADYQSYQDSEIGIYSVTIYGEKPSRCCS
jgi:arsenite methyltransferase